MTSQYWSTYRKLGLDLTRISLPQIPRPPKDPNNPNATQRWIKKMKPQFDELTGYVDTKNLDDTTDELPPSMRPFFQGGPARATPKTRLGDQFEVIMNSKIPPFVLNHTPPATSFTPRNKPDLTSTLRIIKSRQGGMKPTLESTGPVTHTRRPSRYSTQTDKPNTTKE
eukprot:TRINITY_DN17651_c0_g2_i1.p1 TRINITY_DN17651_c0_g2~~TRINITY_DN17651_c0_g2_i1.p1  ORF type:complete len:186 (+),score=46.61 TRINITY_DN17651_c0_g2_i1:57-560(+)